jgi:hypothetical protein
MQEKSTGYKGKRGVKTQKKKKKKGKGQVILSRVFIRIIH